MTKQIRIEKRIPINRGGSAYSLDKYPFDKLKKVDDSFLIEGVNTYQVANLLHRARRLLKVKFISRTTPEGVRVWRKP